MISAIIIAKDEERMIANCISTLRWCDEVVVVDSGSQDNTVELAKREGARVVSLEHPTFAESRNAGKEHAKGEWLLYVDADERVTPVLAQEILSVLSSPGSTLNAYAI